MTRDDFRDYMDSEKLIHFQTVPYSKVHLLHFSRNDIYNIQFKISHGSKEFTTANVRPSLSTRKKQGPLTIPIKVNERDYKKRKIILIKIILSREQNNTKEINEKKKTDLISMLKYMPLIDREYYTTVGVK